jgi:hypothetical protein
MQCSRCRRPIEPPAWSCAACNRAEPHTCPLCHQTTCVPLPGSCWQCQPLDAPAEQLCLGV